jgi:hypothetical protein
MGTQPPANKGKLTASLPLVKWQRVVNMMLCEASRGV